MILLKNCRLVSYLTEGYEGEFGDILLDGSTIQGIYPCGEISDSDLTVYDVQGKTVLPGFIEMHGHLEFSCQNWEYLVNRDQNTYLMECAEYAKNYLKMGYTTVRDCGNNYYASVSVRDGIQKGVLTGSRIITAGRTITPTTRGNSSFGSLYKEIDEPGQMLKACREESAHAVDFIKYMCTGAVLNLGGDPGEFISSPEELESVVKAADTLGLYVAAHCHGTVGIKEAIKAGIYTIEHASYMDQTCVDLIIENGNYSCTVPTFAIPYILANGLSGNQPLEFKEKAMDACGNMANSMKLCMDAGVKVGFGSDMDMASYLEFPGLEFIARESYGFSNEDILKQATIANAEILHMEDKLGTVCAGKYGDLVVFDGKPDEDFSCLKEFPYMVFKEGKRFVY